MDILPEETRSDDTRNERNSKKVLITIIVVLFLLILGIIIFFAVGKSKKNNNIQNIDFEDSNVEFSDETIGNDNLNTIKNVEFSEDFNGVHITKSGALTPEEKTKNIDNLNKDLAKNGNDYQLPEFDDTDPTFSDEKIGKDTLRKMYKKNLSFNIKKPIIPNYDSNTFPFPKLIDIGQTKKEIVGTVYFDYGYANSPKNAVVQTQKTTLGKIDFDEIRYTETLVALRNLLAEIPYSILNKTIFYIDGHTDHVSPYDFNQKLSEARADCIKKILIKDFGINENYIVTKGYSWSKLAVDIMEECAENRRVEISVAFFN